MDHQYVVEFDCTATDSVAAVPESVFERLLDHVADWVGRGADGVDATALLASEGAAAATYIDDKRQYVKNISWRPLRTEEIRCVTCTLRQPLQGSDIASFVVDLTVFADKDQARMRIEMGRDTQGIMRPATVDEVRRPGIVKSLLLDDDLVLRRRGQVVTGKPVKIDSPEEAVALLAALANLHRLPVMIVDARGPGAYPGAYKFAQQAGRELAGLLQVVLVGGEAIAAVNEGLGKYNTQIPLRGTTLVWPDAATVKRHPVFTSDDIHDGWQGADTYRQGANGLVGRLMRMLGPLSVAAAGPNLLLLSATRAVADDRRSKREAELQESIRRAQAAPTQTEQIDQLQDALREQKQQNDDLYDYLAETEARYEKALADQQQAFAQALAEQYRPSAADSGGADDSEPGWELAPDLGEGDLQTLAEFLAETSDGAIVFTDNAIRSWKTSGYPHPGKMRDHLVGLARAACEWRTNRGAIGGRIKEWFHHEYAMTMSMNDEELEKRGADQFQFNGEKYSRVPHLKLDDHTSPNQVGRVYFALDSIRQRFIVDHVGLKLYGLK